MTINNPDAYLRNIWDWKILKGCFGDTMIEPTDIDGQVERNGHFLWLETKEPNVELKQGQEIAFRALADRGDVVLIIWGTKDNPERILELSKGRADPYPNASIETLRHLVTKWFIWADKNGNQ